MEPEISTEQKILEAAEHVFLDEGYAGARMQHIADRAGINKAMLHYYFRSKDKLFALVFRHKIHQFLPQVTATMGDKTIPVMEKVNRFVDTYLSMFRKNQRLPMFILSTMNRNPEFAELINVELGKSVIAMLESEMDKGNIRRVDAHQFVLTLIGMCVFPFLARPVFKGVFRLSNAEYDKIIAERHIHVMDYAHRILSH